MRHRRGRRVASTREGPPLGRHLGRRPDRCPRRWGHDARGPDGPAGGARQHLRSQAADPADERVRHGPAAPRGGARRPPRPGLGDRHRASHRPQGAVQRRPLGDRPGRGSSRQRPGAAAGAGAVGPRDQHLPAAPDAGHHAPRLRLPGERPRRRQRHRCRCGAIHRHDDPVVLPVRGERRQAAAGGSGRRGAGRLHHQRLRERGQRQPPLAGPALQPAPDHTRAARARGPQPRGGRQPAAARPEPARGQPRRGVRGVLRRERTAPLRPRRGGPARCPPPHHPARRERPRAPGHVGAGVGGGVGPRTHRGAPPADRTWPLAGQEGLRRDDPAVQGRHARVPQPRNERKRQKVNRWIRTSGEYDAVIDFAAAVRDPMHPRRLLPRYDSGDHLHPNDAGMRALAQAVPLRLFR